MLYFKQQQSILYFSLLRLATKLSKFEQISTPWTTQRELRAKMEPSDSDLTLEQDAVLRIKRIVTGS
jgi:hypothetical protein